MVQNQPLAFLEQIEQHGGPVVTELVKEYHHYHSKSKRTLSQGAAAVAAITVAVLSGCYLTPHAITALGVSGSLGTALVTAAVPALSSQFAVGMLNNQGNLGRV